MPTFMSEPTFHFSTYPAGCPRNGAFDRNDGTDFYVQTDQPSALVPGEGPDGRGTRRIVRVFGAHRRLTNPRRPTGVDGRPPRRHQHGDGGDNYQPPHNHRGREGRR